MASLTTLQRCHRFISISKAVIFVDRSTREKKNLVEMFSTFALSSFVKICSVVAEKSKMYHIYPIRENGSYIFVDRLA